MQRASHHDLRAQFRALLASSACYHTASVFDPMSARIAADLGFEVGILGGSVASLQVLAAPDFALITLSEFVEQATRIGRVARLPVIADADHGYGNALNVMRTVVELERAGVAALTLEDTLLPAQFGRKSTDLIGVDEGAQILLDLRRALAAIEDRRNLLALADDYSGRDSQGHYDNSNDADTAINCVDEPPLTDRAAAVDEDRRMRQVAPFMNYGQFTGNAPLDTCAFWPAPPTSGDRGAAPSDPHPR